MKTFPAPKVHNKNTITQNSLSSTWNALYPLVKFVFSYIFLFVFICFTSLFPTNWQTFLASNTYVLYFQI